MDHLIALVKDKDSPVESRRIMTLLLGCLDVSSAVNAQWRIADTTLFNLIQNGYAIAAVTMAARTTGLSKDTYVLQKNNSVFQCPMRRNTRRRIWRDACKRSGSLCGSGQAVS